MFDVFDIIAFVVFGVLLAIPTPGRCTRPSGFNPEQRTDRRRPWHGARGARIDALEPLRVYRT
jgi:hypothetical protein